MDESSVEAEIESLWINIGLLFDRVRDTEKRFDTLQSPWWKRLWFRIDGWPGIRDLNAPQRAWRPWHRKR